MAARGVGAREDGARHPKRSDGVLREGVAEKYAWIFLFRAMWPITLICEVLNVSVSGYLEHQRRRAQDRPSVPGGRHSNEALLAHIRAIHAAVKGEYARPRVWQDLLARSIPVGKDRIQRLIKAHGIKARDKKTFVVTTDSKHSLPVAENLLGRDFTPSQPDRVWSSDITYIATEKSWLYLACVIDLFSRQVVAWSMQPHMQTSLVADALRMGWFRRHPGPGLILHSDRGSQYCSREFRAALASYSMRSSMSRNGNCWDNLWTTSINGKAIYRRLNRYCTSAS